MKRKRKIFVLPLKVKTATDLGNLLNSVLYKPMREIYTFLFGIPEMDIFSVRKMNLMIV